MKKIFIVIILTLISVSLLSILLIGKSKETKSSDQTVKKSKIICVNNTDEAGIKNDSLNDCKKECEKKYEKAKKICEALSKYDPSSKEQCLKNAKTEYDNCIEMCN